MANVVPLRMTLPPSPTPAPRHSQAQPVAQRRPDPAGLARVMFGSADISWENRRGQHYYQLHWHIGMCTTNSQEADQATEEALPPEEEA